MSKVNVEIKSVVMIWKPTVTNHENDVLTKSALICQSKYPVKTALQIPRYKIIDGLFFEESAEASFSPWHKRQS